MKALENELKLLPIHECRIQDLEQKLETCIEAKIELEGLIGKMGNSVISSSMEDPELTKLRFDKEAIEHKMKKLITDCRNFEGQQAQILNVLRTSKHFNGADENDIAQSIVSLCDKLRERQHVVAMMESQLSKLVNVEGKHQREITSLEDELVRRNEEFLSLKRKAADYKARLTKLANENSSFLHELKMKSEENNSLARELQRMSEAAPNARDSTQLMRIRTPMDKENSLRNTDPRSKKVARTKGMASVDKSIEARLEDAFAASNESTQEWKLGCVSEYLSKN